jgi:hypothetical protein
VLTLGDRKKASRKRAVGTREHIIAYLTGTRELFDPGGMASTRLAAAVGYPGSSVAFAQLLSGMERSGLIERDVRGKRTYRIGLGPAAAPGAVPGAASGPAGAGGLAELLAPGAGPHSGAGTAGFDYDELARRLLAEIAGVWAKQGQLAEANARLREQLRAAERSLALARESPGEARAVGA